MDLIFGIVYNDQTHGHIPALLIQISPKGRYSFPNLHRHSLWEPHKKQYSFVLGFFSHPVGLFYNRVRQESTLYAITGDKDGKTQVLTLGSFGEGKAPLTGAFIDYLAEAGIDSAEVPEMLEGEPLLTLEPSELQVYQPPVSQDARP